MFHLSKLLKSLCTNNNATLKGLKYASVCYPTRRQLSSSTGHIVYRRYCQTHMKQIDGLVDKDTADGNDQGLELHEATQLIEDMRLSGRQVPYQISDADLEYFSSLKSKKQRKRFVTFLYRKESMKLKDKQRRLEKREQREKESENEIVDYGPMPNRIFLKLNPKSILEFDNWKLSQGMKFGQNIVFDFSYDQYMRRPDTVSLSMQMSYVIHENKHAKQSFHLRFVNHLEGSLSHKEMVRTTREDSYNKMMVTMSSESLLNTFPKEELIYLSPDSPNIMKSYDHTKTYVIGALVDGGRIEKGVSLGMAKRLGVAHVRLPIDYYLQWGSGSGKDLTLDQVMKILTTMKDTEDWKEAMKHVPTRKHRGIKTADTFSNKVSKKVYEARLGVESNEDEFVFSRARPRNNSVDKLSMSNKKQTFQGAFIDNKPGRFKEKSIGNKSAQKKINNFWDK